MKIHTDLELVSARNDDPNHNHELHDAEMVVATFDHAIRSTTSQTQHTSFVETFDHKSHHLTNPRCIVGIKSVELTQLASLKQS